MAISFKRTVSTFIADLFANKAALNSRTYQTELAAEIVLQDATVLTYATASLSINSLSQGTASVPITPIVFSPRVSSRPEIRHSQTKSSDSSQLEIVNLDHLISQLIPHEDRVFDNASITAYLCFPKGDGNYEGLIYFFGKIADLIGDDELVNISPISDITAKIAFMGKELTQRCVNELGDAWCAVTFLPPGAICTKIYADRQAGCLYWGGVFNGVPYVNPSNRIQGYNGPVVIEPPWGPGEGGPLCADPASWYRSANGGHIQGYDIREGESILWNETVVEVTEAEIIHAEFRYRLETEIGVNLNHSASHRFLIDYDDDLGKPAHSIYPNKFDLMVRTPDRGRFKLKPCDELGVKDFYGLTPIHSGKGLRLATTFPHKYDVGETKGFTIESHNTKNQYTIVGGPQA